MSQRKLKHHEAVLLKKHNFYQSKRDTNLGELVALRRYHIQDRSDYQKYNRLVGRVHALAHRLKKLPSDSAFRAEMSKRLLTKLFEKGLIGDTSTLQNVENVTVSCFCRRRLPVVMQRLKMAQTVAVASKLVHDGHIRVGPMTVTDPAFMLSRSMEDHVTWVDSSKIKRTIAKYNDKLDDFDLAGA